LHGTADIRGHDLSACDCGPARERHSGPACRPYLADSGASTGIVRGALVLRKEARPYGGLPFFIDRFPWPASPRERPACPCGPHCASATTCAPAWVSPSASSSIPGRFG